MKICTKCHLPKNLNEFYDDVRYENRLMARCKKCHSSYVKPGGSYYKRHILRCKQYRDANKENKKIYNKKYDMKEYIKKRKKIDPLFLLSCSLRSRLTSALRVKKWIKNSKFTEYIGCSLQELKNHLENQFKLGMNWKNHGKWEIDHIKPLSKAKTAEELYLRCHYSNLQPLWKSENREKHTKEQSLSY